MRALRSVEVGTDLGLDGDRKARAGSHRQVTVAWAEQLAAVAAELGVEIAPGATRRNVTLEGLAPDARPGARLRVGPVLLELTVPADPCGLMDELIGEGACAALRDRAGWAARVVEGGRLEVGDAAAWA
jgi:MOSC domain-containing protein YiiM